mmetsp:Transcript_102422/g.176842  ORF Transcript_102422/g.176842 Transcript_102422/m.176842 type:complete len:231 (-) Transcript_102422:1453-2145(-)
MCRPACILLQCLGWPILPSTSPWLSAHTDSCTNRCGCIYHAEHKGYAGIASKVLLPAAVVQTNLPVAVASAVVDLTFDSVALSSEPAEHHELALSLLAGVHRVSSAGVVAMCIFGFLALVPCFGHMKRFASPGQSCDIGCMACCISCTGTGSCMCMHSWLLHSLHCTMLYSSLGSILHGVLLLLHWLHSRLTTSLGISCRLTLQACWWLLFCMLCSDLVEIHRLIRWCGA